MTPGAGYSSTPLPRKLGIKPGTRVLLVEAPPGLDIEPLPPHVTVVRSTSSHPAPFDLALFFTTSRSDLADRFAELTGRLAAAGGLWVCWPKRASGVPTDVTENFVRDVALPQGWVDTKVCAIDDTWSGLRLVLRLKNRPKAEKA